MRVRVVGGLGAPRILPCAPAWLAIDSELTPVSAYLHEPCTVALTAPDPAKALGADEFACHALDPAECGWVFGGYAMPLMDPVEMWGLESFGSNSCVTQSNHYLQHHVVTTSTCTLRMQSGTWLLYFPTRTFAGQPMKLRSVADGPEAAGRILRGLASASRAPPGERPNAA